MFRLEKKYLYHMNNSFYSSIADHYDFIFPFNAQQVNFIKQHVSNTAVKKVLEVGCGTGNLTFGLASEFSEVIGIDLDEEMLNRAITKNSFEHVSFKAMDMLTIGNEFKEGSLDSIACFGNTLVHLNSLQQINSFFAMAKKVLTNDGSLMLQIINYDRILDQNIRSLPTIENEDIRFIRNYSYNKEDYEISFDTELLIKHSGKVIMNSQTLLPIRKKEIWDLLKKYFKEISFYSNFKADKYSRDAVPLIIMARE